MMSAVDVLRVIRTIMSVGISVQIDGGWGIDALVGVQTRDHDDLDLVIPRDRIADVMDALGTHGFTLSIDERPVRLVLRAADDRRIDVHPIRLDAEGNGWQAMPDGSEALYPRDGLTGEGKIAGTVVPCITAQLQIAHHEGYEPDDKDLHDMRLLRDCLGVTLPISSAAYLSTHDSTAKGEWT